MTKIIAGWVSFLQLSCLSFTINGSIMNRLILSVLFLIPLVSVSQSGPDTIWVNRKYIDSRSIMIGTGFGGAAVRAQNRATNRVETATVLQFDPRIAFMPTRSICLGATGSIGTVYGTLVPEYSYHGIGAFGRFYPFMKLRDRILRRDEMQFFGMPAFQHLRGRDRSFIAQNLYPYFETGILWQDIQIVKSGNPVLLNGMSEKAVHIAAGLEFRVFKGLCIEAGLIKVFYPDNQSVSSSRLGTRFGIEYFIPTRKPE